MLPTFDKRTLKINKKVDYCIARIGVKEKKEEDRINICFPLI